jgi:hypothetical protein
MVQGSGCNRTVNSARETDYDFVHERTFDVFGKIAEDMTSYPLSQIQSELTVPKLFLAS